MTRVQLQIFAALTVIHAPSSTVEITLNIEKAKRELSFNPVLSRETAWLRWQGFDCLISWNAAVWVGGSWSIGPENASLRSGAMTSDLPVEAVHFTAFTKAWHNWVAIGPNKVSARA